MIRIPIERVALGRRLRTVSEAQVERLAASIAEIGLLNPITVHEQKLVSNGRAVDGYGLIAGAHRIEAYKRLGMDEIPAVVVALSDLERQIAECDENLVGPSLTPSEKAWFIRRRKDAYEALHPETRVGANQHTRVRQLGEPTPADRFTADTAAKTGVSERAIQRAAARGARISDKALTVVRGTKLDTGAYLDQLAKVPEAEQVAAIKRDLAGQPTPPTSEHEKNVASLMSAWNKADRRAREEFLRRINISIFGSKGDKAS